MRRASIAFLLALAACGSHGTSSGDDGNGDDGNGGDDGPHQNATSVTVTLDNRPTNAAMFTFVVAYQDGAGPWMLAPAPAGDTYTLPIYSPVYSVAWTCVGSTVGANAQQIRQVSTASFSIAERTSLTFDVPPRCTDRNAMNAPLHGTIANANGGGGFIVKWGDRSIGAIDNQGTTTFAMEVPPGTHDLVVLHTGLIAVGGDLIVDSALIKRNVTVSGPTAANVDFNNGEPVLQFGVSIPVGAGRRIAQTTFYTAGGTTGQLVTDANTPWETEAFATDQQAAGDVYDQQMSVSVGGQTASETRATSDPADQTWVSPAPLGGAASTSMSAPYPRITTTWPAYTGAVGYTWVAAQTPSLGQCGSTACQIVWTALLSPGVSGMMPTYTMPDLSALAGWSTTLQLVPGVLVAGTAAAQTSTAGATDFPPATPPADGTLRLFVRSDYTVSP
jgi:hypothetical protein